MASLSRDPNGCKRILYVDGDGNRRAVRLGAASVKVAESFKGRVEALNAAQIAGAAPGSDLAAWVRDLPNVIHKRLARVGLVEPRSTASAPVTVGDLLDRFENSAAVKASTRAAYRQTTASLRESLGATTAVAALTGEHADRWRKEIEDSGLAAATVAKRVHTARAIFRKAVRWRLMASSPFAELRAGSQANPDRSVYVARETIDAALRACPDDEWRAIIALCRNAGLRCPSEIVRLTWGDVHWEIGRMTVRSAKTARHDGHATRVVPMAPELRTILLALFDQAEPGTARVISRLRDSAVNLRTHFLRIIARAGLKPWPRLFHNLRASCATDWCERFPNHVAAGWLGHSPMIAAQHYLHTRDAHFDLAAGLTPGGAECGARAAQNAAQHAAAQGRAESHESSNVPARAADTRAGAAGCDVARSGQVGDTGLEPVTSRV